VDAVGVLVLVVQVAVVQIVDVVVVQDRLVPAAGAVGVPVLLGRAVFDDCGHVDRWSYAHVCTAIRMPKVPPDVVG
jgi:hypothetical protein